MRGTKFIQEFEGKKLVATMSKMKNPLTVRSAFTEYTLDEILGEGGAGRVYGGVDDTGIPIAVKVLHTNSSNKKRRFKNETNFLFRSNHKNLIKVIDFGVYISDRVNLSFYVMPRYLNSLRGLIGMLQKQSIMRVFSEILDGVEAAHLLGVVHRDLKPENILCNGEHEIRIADFGIASFTMDQLATIIATSPAERLANFQYAAPEQRMTGSKAGVQADIYALGLIFNEMYTGRVPHGTSYTSISHIYPDLEYLDRIVDKMLKQDQAERYDSVASVKNALRQFQFEAITLQKLDHITNSIIREDQLEDSLAYDPPKITYVRWENRRLYITLDRPVSTRWVQTMYHDLGSYTSVVGSEPQRFQFNGQEVNVPAEERSAQTVIDNFKSWLPQTSSRLKLTLETEQQMKLEQEKQHLERQRAAEEQNLRVNRLLRF